MKKSNHSFLLLLIIFSFQLNNLSASQKTIKSKFTSGVYLALIQAEKNRVILLANQFLKEKPITVTASQCVRSAGRKHDYYSEATYWWPNPENPDGPYIRKDGLNNPENFDNHLKAIGRFSWIVGTETSAYLLTGKKQYAQHAVKHLKAWFVDSASRMNPHLLYAQAIKGVNTGRGIGIIDAISLIEVVKSVEILQQSPYLSTSDAATIKQWFASFLNWLNTHPYGIDEMNAKNNHGTWWHAQVAAYASFTGDRNSLEKCRQFYVKELLTNQMAIDGSFPLETARTKPYAYSLFNLDGAATLAWIVSGWDFGLADGRGMRKAVGFIKPYILDKSSWPFPKDVLYWDEPLGRRPFMFFEAIHKNSNDWLEIWKKASADFPSEESKRNMPLKNAILWMGMQSPMKLKTEKPKTDKPITEKWLQNAISRSEAQLLLAAETYKDKKLSPRTFQDGTVRFVGIKDWCSGFFPGSLWYLYELTGNPKLKMEAQRYTELLEEAKKRKNTHDLGFILGCSYGNGYRITGNEAYKKVMIEGANSLMTRFYPHVGLMKSWDKRNRWNYPVIIDNMMNLEFLYKMGKLTNNQNMQNACISHADLTLKNHFRVDNSCVHVVNYDSITGKIVEKVTHQGFNNNSSWARGQAWALYGYTMMYRETGKSIYLEQAQKVAAFILNHPRLPKDLIPYWDFDAPNIPNEPRDASAAAIFASALIELSTFTNEKNNYLTSAEIILKNLSLDNYLAKIGENGLFILKHSTGNWPAKDEIDTPISYADYYYLEALKRMKNYQLGIKN